MYAEKNKKWPSKFKMAVKISKKNSVLKMIFIIDTDIALYLFIGAHLMVLGIILLVRLYWFTIQLMPLWHP